VKALREIGSGALVSALFIALSTVLPIGAAIAVAVPFIALLVLAQVADWRDRKLKTEAVGGLSISQQQEELT
jgi:hypothetical protein